MAANRGKVKAIFFCSLTHTHARTNNTNPTAVTSCKRQGKAHVFTFSLLLLVATTYSIGVASHWHTKSSPSISSTSNTALVYDGGGQKYIYMYIYYKISVSKWISLHKVNRSDTWPWWGGFGLKLEGMEEGALQQACVWGKKSDKKTWVCLENKRAPVCPPSSRF